MKVAHYLTAAAPFIAMVANHKVTNLIQLGAAKALAQQAQQLEPLPVGDREPLVQAFTSLKQQVESASLKIGEKNRALTAIDGTIEHIRSGRRPAGLGNGHDLTAHQHDKRSGVQPHAGAS